MQQNLRKCGTGIKAQNEKFDFLCLDKTKWCGWGNSRLVSCFQEKNKWRA